MGRLSFNCYPTLFLAGLLAVSAFAGHSALAIQGFTNASLQGSYAYVNNTGNVASLGPITFDGSGGLSVDIIANLPCPGDSPAANCDRSINDLPPATGTYNVEANGTGIAEIEFSTGTVKYDFIISEATKNGTTLLATKIFAAGQSGGLNGQLIAPTWSRILVKHDKLGRATSGEH